MPSPNAAVQQKPNAGTPVVREIYVYALTNRQKAAEIEPNFYTEIKTKLVAKIKSDANGHFKVALPVGYYSLFVKEEKGLYANLFDDAMNINAVVVNKREWSKVELLVDYGATY